MSAVVIIGACSAERVQERLQPTERAVQPAVSAFVCGSGSVRSAIANCRAEGGHYGHCAIVASRSGVADATTCYTYAEKVHRRREQLMGQEYQLDAQLRYLQDVNVDTEDLNTELKMKIEEVTARTDTAVDSVAQGQMTETELVQLRLILDNEVSSARGQLDVASHELQAAQQFRARQQSSATDLDTEIGRLEALLKEAHRQTDVMVAQRNRI